MPKDDSRDVMPVVVNEDGILKLVVEKTDASLIIDNKMQIKMVIQDLPENAPVPLNMAIISAIATRLNIDPNFATELLDFIEDVGTVDEFGITRSMNKLNYELDNTASDNGIVWN